MGRRKRKDEGRVNNREERERGEEREEMHCQREEEGEWTDDDSGHGMQCDSLVEATLEYRPGNKQDQTVERGLKVLLHLQILRRSVV